MRSLFQILSSLIALSGLILSGAYADAAAPPSLEGHLIRLYTAYASVHDIEFRSIAFHANGIAQDNWVVYKSGNMPNVVYANGLPVTWTYTYQKLSDSSAELTLTTKGGGYNKLTLTFTDDQNGTVDENPLRWAGFFGSFQLIEGSAQPNPLINISTRVRVHSGEPTIVGFVCSRSADFLIRVAGPALTNFQVQDVWKTPQFHLVAGLDNARYITPARVSGRWDSFYGISDTFQRVGAFPFAPGSNDVAVIVGLEPGPYTIVVQPDADDPGGNALIEVYQLY